MLNQSVSRSFNSWLSFLLDRKKLKRLGLKIFNKLVNKNLFAGFKQFKRVVMMLKDATDETAIKERQEQRNQKLITRILNRLTKKALVNCFELLAVNRNQRVKTRRLLNRYFGPMDSDFTRSAFRMWRAQVKSHSLQETILLLQHKDERIQLLEARLLLLEDKTQNLALSKAKSMIQMWQNKCLINTLNSWIVWTKSEIEDKIKLDRFVKKWKNLEMYAIFFGWKSTVVENKKNKLILRRFLQKLQNSTLSKVVLFWALFVKQR